MNFQPHIRIFEPLFTYDRVGESCGKWSALKSFLGLTDAMDASAYCHELRTAYYRYGSHIAVLLKREGKWYCQTYLEGVRGALYDVLADADALRAFCEQGEGRLTVLENDHAFALKPSFEALMKFVQTMNRMDDLGREHDAVIGRYAKQLRAFQDEFRDLSGYSPKSDYEQLVDLLNAYLVELSTAAHGRVAEEKLTMRDCFQSDENDLYRTFGLFVYALSLGLKRHRYLKRYKSLMALAFREMLQEMRTFLEVHPHMEQEYADFMGLSRNDRELLSAMLTSEGLYGDPKDDGLF